MKSDDQIRYRLGGVLQLSEIALAVTDRCEIGGAEKNEVLRSIRDLITLVQLSGPRTDKELMRIDFKFDVLLRLMDFHRGSITPEEIVVIEDAKKKYRIFAQDL